MNVVLVLRAFQTRLVYLALPKHSDTNTMRYAHCQPTNQCVLSLRKDAAALVLLVACVTASIRAAGLMFAGASATTCCMQ
jgi:hypothetical protein